MRLQIILRNKNPFSTLAFSFFLLSELSCVHGVLAATALTPCDQALIAVPVSAERRDASIRQAVDLVKQQEQKVRQAYSTSGFADENELLQAIQQAGPQYQRAAAILKSEDLEVVVAAPLSRRSEIISSGIKNFHETGKTSGSAMVDRNAVEAAYFREDLQKYSALDNSIKPKSAYLSPKLDSGLKPPAGVWSYGEDRWIMKLANIRNRITISVGDSLNHVAQTMGPGSTPWIVGRSEWDTYFVPWSQRMLIAPALGQGIEKGTLGLPIEIITGSTRDIEEEARGSLSKPQPLAQAHSPTEQIQFAFPINRLKPIDGALGKYKVLNFWDLDYFEIQILGDIEAEDYQAFEFTRTPPTGEFLNELRRLGIEIRDGRSQPPKIWKPVPKEKIDQDQRDRRTPEPGVI